MKLVNCHHVRKRRRHRPVAPARCGSNNGCHEEELLKLMMIVVGVGGGVGDYVRLQRDDEKRSDECDSRWGTENGLPRTRTTTTTTTTTSKATAAAAAIATTRTKTTISKSEEGRKARIAPDKTKLATGAQSRRRPLSSRLPLLVYAALVCLVVCNDSVDRLTMTTTTTASCRGLVPGASANPDANRLYEDLMMTYNRIVTPTRNSTEKLIVRLGLKLSQLMDVNLKNQMMTINLWLNQEWFDYKLEWDPSEYGGITEINLPAEQIWLPDIVLYNSAEGYFAVSIMTKAKVRHDGYVIWNPPAIFRSFCQIDITHFPFDIQDCHLKFGSWTFGDKLELRHINQSAVAIERGADLSEYYQNVEWDIMRASAIRNSIKYECCPDPYFDITFHFKLRRKPLFYTVNLILPCVGITFFSFLVFYLPSDSGEKVTLTISILVSLIFFLSVLIETIPSTSLAMPLLGKYLVFTMILITLSVCATVGVLNIHFRTPSTHSMPTWVKRWCMDILPKYLFMSVPQYQQNNILPEQLIYLHNPAYATQAIPLPLNKPSEIVVVAGLAQQSSNSLVEHLQQQQQASCCPSSLISMNQAQAAQSLSSASLQRLYADQKQQQHHHLNNNNNNINNEMGQTSQFTHSMSVQSMKQPQELNAAHLMSANNQLQARPTTFLPYLQSEAARRLQLQRSRSSEKDNKSTSDNQPTTSGASNENATGSGAGNTGGSEVDSDRARDKQERSGAQGNLRVVINDAKGKKSKSSNPIWRLFKTGKTEQTQRDAESNKLGQSTMAPARHSQQNQQHQQLQQQHHQQRLSHSSTGSSMIHEDDDDDYRHHRHFQARASICSNNLWRIGPTRRCSLAVPMINYPSYYRPLAQLQQQQQRRGSGSGGGSMLNTISGGSCLPPIVSHRHLNGEDSETTSTSMSSRHNRYGGGGGGGGGTIGGLINQATSLAQHPERMSDGSRLSRLQHEMAPMTSGGFISINSPAQRGVNAVPPRRLVATPTSPYNSDSQINNNNNDDIPTPPPPLPPDFVESSSLIGENRRNNLTEATGAPLIRTNYYPHPPPQQQQQQQPDQLDDECSYSSSQRTVAEYEITTATRMTQNNDERGHPHHSILDRELSTSSMATTTIQQHPNYVPNEVRQSMLCPPNSIRPACQYEKSVPVTNLPRATNDNVQSFQLNDAKMPTASLYSRYDNTTEMVARASILDSLPAHITSGALPHYNAMMGGQHSMPRSHSSDRRLPAKLNRESTAPSANQLMSNIDDHVHRLNQHQQQASAAAAYVTSLHNNHSVPVADSFRRQQYQSIGRQLGQAYIQRLQRQPAVCSMQHLSRTMLPCNRDVHAMAMANRAAEQLRYQQSTHSAANRMRCRGEQHVEPSIDMLRRSKSQTSLNRSANVGHLSDCKHCLAEGALLSGNHQGLSTNHHHHQQQQHQFQQHHVDHRQLQARPQSEMRARVNSAGYQWNRADGHRWQGTTNAGYHQHNERRINDEANQGVLSCMAPPGLGGSVNMRTMPIETAKSHFIIGNDEKACRCSALGDSIIVTPQTNQRQLTASGSATAMNAQMPTLNLLKLINEVDKAIQNAMFIAQHIDNLDEFESVKENWKYIAMVIDRIFLIVFLFICIVGTVAIFAMVPWTYYLNERPIDLDLTRFQALNLTSGDTLKHGCP